MVKSTNCIYTFVLQLSTMIDKLLLIGPNFSKKYESIIISTHINSNRHHKSNFHVQGMSANFIFWLRKYICHSAFGIYEKHARYR